MFDAIASTFKELGISWSKLAPGKKLGASAILFIIMGCILAFGAWVGEKSYTPLYKEMSPENSIALVKFLQQERIPYLVGDEGQTVSIPPEFVQQTLMKLAIQGMPGGNKPGMELFDKESFGTSSYVQRINYTRALQGELTRTINTLKAVKKTSVHISMPPKQSFLQESEAPKASVVIELYPGSSIIKNEVEGIQNLVAFSVEGLRPNRVTVVDNTGRSLSSPGDESSAVSAALAERQRQVEKSYEANIESMLSKMYGQGNVVVRVNAELDFDPVREQQTIVDPEQSVVLQQNKQEDSMQTKRPDQGAAGGVASADGPAPAGAQGAIPGAEGADVEKNDTTQSVEKVSDRSTFDVSRTVRQKEKALGSIKRVSVAVLVNNPMVKGESGAMTAQPISDEDKSKVLKLVKGAVGFVQGRDEITVESSAFAREDFDKADEMLIQQERRQLLFWVLRYSTIALLAFVFALAVVRPFIRWLTGLSSTTVEKILPKTVEELEQIEDVTTNALPGLANMPLLEETVDLEKAESEMLREKLISLVDMSPGKAAQILTEWIGLMETTSQRISSKRK
ncbi:flagellar M-ring protein FliF [bacterium]|nr:flagellar M-ring protein FliF [bacterium]